VLTLRGGPELVAAWGQLGSIIELVAGVALAGVGTGISVLVAQSGRLDRQQRLLRESMKLGVAVSVPVMFAVAAVCWVFPDTLAGSGVSRSLLVLGAAIGCAAVVPGMVNGYWLGQQRRDRMLALALVAALLPLVAAIGAPPSGVLGAVAVAQALPAFAVLFAIGARPAAAAAAPGSVPGEEPGWEQSRRMLRRYLVPGLAIGVLSPASMLAARSIVSGALSWNDAGLLQSLWRVSEWVASVAGGFMAVHFLPRLSAAHGTPQFAIELRRTAWMTVAPAALALAVLFAFQRPVFELLYGPDFRMSDATVALFFAGTLARIASWVPLFALYAMRRTRSIAAGELLSLPLFAALLGLFREGLTLERASAMWLAAYVAYWLFNRWRVMRG
jgi:O-antigen/teichoic acid export membrane protein